MFQQRKKIWNFSVNHNWKRNKKKVLFDNIIVVKIVGDFLVKKKSNIITILIKIFFISFEF